MTQLTDNELASLPELLFEFEGNVRVSILKEM
jgi:hypothetical protein